MIKAGDKVKVLNCERTRSYKNTVEEIYQSIGEVGIVRSVSKSYSSELYFVALERGDFWFTPATVEKVEDPQSIEELLARADELTAELLKIDDAITELITPKLTLGTIIRRYWDIEHMAHRSDYMVIGCEDQPTVMLLDLETYDFHVSEMYSNIKELEKSLDDSGILWGVLED